MPSCLIKPLATLSVEKTGAFTPTGSINTNKNRIELVIPVVWNGEALRLTKQWNF